MHCNGRCGRVATVPSRLNQLRLLEREYYLKRKAMLQAEHRKSTFDFDYGILVGQLMQIQDKINYREHKEGKVGFDL